jgi:hypothetical protein
MEKVVKRYAVFRNHVWEERKLMGIYHTDEIAHEVAANLAETEPANLNYTSYPYYYEITPVYTTATQDRSKLY